MHTNGLDLDNFFQISVKNSSYDDTFGHLMLKKICSRLRLIEQDEQNEVRWMSTLDVKVDISRCQKHMNNCSR